MILVGHQEEDLKISYIWPREFGALSVGASPYSSQLMYKDTGKSKLMTAKRQKRGQTYCVAGEMVILGTETFLTQFVIMMMMMGLWMMLRMGTVFSME